MITLLGSVAEGNDIAVERIEEALRHPQALRHNSNFTGRPATQLYVIDTYVVKLRTDFVFQAKDAHKRCQAALAADRSLQAYHPLKTWFVLSSKQEPPVIGSITPRLTTFNNALPELLKENPALALQQLIQLLTLYCNVAHNTGLRLDEGLSNFGWDALYRVYYLDDDRYKWDDFTSLSSILAVWIRQLEDFTPEYARTLGSDFARVLQQVFGSRHKIQVLLGQLRHGMTVSAREKQCIEALSGILTQHAFPKQKKNTTIKKAVTETNHLDTATNTPGHTRITDQRFGLIADIHANLPALEAVLKALDQQHIEQLLVLGDIVGYGPYPAECIALLQERKAVIIQGNHDYAAATGDISKGFSKLAQWAINWTRGVIDSRQAQWLADLPPIYHQQDWLAVHGAPIDKNYFYGYVYHMTYEANLDWLEQHQHFCAFHGHSHIPVSYVRSRSGDSKLSDRLADFSQCQHALICPGSVGQPRNGGTAAEFAVFDAQTRQLELMQVEYNLEQMVSHMRELNFPATLYERLMQGR